MIEIILNSLKTKQYTLPFLFIRKDDWVNHELFFRKNGERIAICWNNVSVRDIEKELKCSNSNVVSIGEEMERKLYTDTCRHGKFLQNNGSVSEQFCIRSTCSKLGSSCPKSFIFPEDDFPIRLPCSLTNGSIVTLQSADKILTPARLPAKHRIEQNPDYCCHGTNTSQSSYLEVLGEGCFDEWRDVATFHQWCHFTPWVKGVCDREMLQVYRLCMVPGLPCVIREYFVHACSNGFRLPLCSNSTNVC